MLWIAAGCQYPDCHDANLSSPQRRALQSGRQYRVEQSPSQCAAGLSIGTSLILLAASTCTVAGQSVSPPPATGGRFHTASSDLADTRPHTAAEAPVVSAAPAYWLSHPLTSWLQGKPQHNAAHTSAGCHKLAHSKIMLVASVVQAGASLPTQAHNTVLWCSWHPGTHCCTHIKCCRRRGIRNTKRCACLLPPKLQVLLVDAQRHDSVCSSLAPCSRLKLLSPCRLLTHPHNAPFDGAAGARLLLHPVNLPAAHLLCNGAGSLLVVDEGLQLLSAVQLALLEGPAG